jgi:signal transduction histidine kinase
VVLCGLGLFLRLRLQADLNHTVDEGLHAHASAVRSLLHSLEGDFGDTNGPLGRGRNGFGQIITRSGRVVDATYGLRRARLLSPAQLVRARHDDFAFDRPAGGPVAVPARILATSAVSGHRSLVVVVGEALGHQQEELKNFTHLLIAGGVAALVVASLAGYLVARFGLAPVERMRLRAAAISASEPGARLPRPARDDELGRLGETLNGMLARLEDALARERRFVADASHELRTPLAILKAECELALRGRRSAAELTDALRSAGEETDRLARLAEDLLVIAQAQDGRLPVRAEDVELGQSVGWVLARLAPRVAPDALRDEVPAGLRVRADPLRLEQALRNLVDNALRHGGGTATVTARRREDRVRVSVTDTGPGFPQAFLDRAFERFSRSDAARTGDGAGLGLAIVHALAHAMDGEAHVANRSQGGAEAWIELPAGAGAPPAEGVARRPRAGSTSD